LLCAAFAFAACDEAEPTGASSGNGSAVDAAGSDARTTDASRDAAPDANRDAGRDALTCDPNHFPIITDAGTPPPDCIPPCLWEMLKNCPPLGAPGVPDYERDVIRDQFCRGCGCSNDVYANGCFCYRKGTSGVPPSCSMLATTWSDAKGNVATSYYGIIYCGGVRAPDCLNTPSTCDVLVPGSYRADLSQPHCAPWRDYY